MTEGAPTPLRTVLRHRLVFRCLPRNPVQKPASMSSSFSLDSIRDVPRIFCRLSSRPLLSFAPLGPAASCIPPLLRHTLVFYAVLRHGPAVYRRGDFSPVVRSNRVRIEHYGGYFERVARNSTSPRRRDDYAMLQTTARRSARRGRVGIAGWRHRGRLRREGERERARGSDRCALGIDEVRAFLGLCSSRTDQVSLPEPGVSQTFRIANGPLILFAQWKKSDGEGFLGEFFVLRFNTRRPSHGRTY